MAQRVCRAELHAAAALLPGARMRITDSDPTNIECVVSRGRIKVDIQAQAQALAWMELGEVATHFMQAWGTGTIHVGSEQPVLCCWGRLGVPPDNVFWVPAEKELFATNGTETTGGSYVTATVKGAFPRSSSLALAIALTREALHVAPRGGSPGPPTP